MTDSPYASDVLVWYADDGSFACDDTIAFVFEDAVCVGSGFDLLNGRRDLQYRCRTPEEAHRLANTVRSVLMPAIVTARVKEIA